MGEVTEVAVEAVTASVEVGAEGAVEASAVWMSTEAKTVKSAEVKMAAKAMAVAVKERMTSLAATEMVQAMAVVSRAAMEESTVTVKLTAMKDTAEMVTETTRREAVIARETISMTITVVRAPQ